MEQRQRDFYKAAQAYHARHDPPQAGAEYWKWALADLRTVASLYEDDPLLIDLLKAVFAELERGCLRLMEGQRVEQPAQLQ